MTLSRKVILFAMLTAYIFVAAADTAQSQESLKRRIDELFMIASSAELKVRDQVEPAKDSIAALGVDAVPILVEKFTTKSARERHTIIHILKRIGSPAVPYLVRSLNHPDGLVVQRVCWALGDIGDSTAVDPLIGVAMHERWQVREQALGALGDIGSARPVDAVLSGFSDPIGQVRTAAVVAAGKAELDQLARSLVSMLGDSFYGARLSAVEALSKLDTATVLEAVADSMNSANSLVGDLGCQILGRIATDDAMEVLVIQASSADPERRAHAAVAIVAADPLDNCGYIESIAERETDRFVLLKIESAVHTAKDARQETEN